MSEQKELYFHAKLKADHLITYINYTYEDEEPTEEDLQVYVQELIEDDEIDLSRVLTDIEITAVFNNNEREEDE